MTRTTLQEPYTREIADRLVPLLRRILQDLRDAYLTLRFHVPAFKSLEDLPALRAGDLPEAARDVLAELRSCLGEIEELGVTIEQPELGLVSFPGIAGDRVVSFCWKLGEDSILYWFPLDGLYQDRIPLATV